MKKNKKKIKKCMRIDHVIALFRCQIGGEKNPLQIEKNKKKHEDYVIACFRCLSPKKEKETKKQKQIRENL
jgi:5-methylcytosine-specific restriction endonuclease McrA